jgi:hypothetical protein
MTDFSSYCNYLGLHNKYIVIAFSLHPNRDLTVLAAITAELYVPLFVTLLLCIAFVYILSRVLQFTNQEVQSLLHIEIVASGSIHPAGRD